MRRHFMAAICRSMSKFHDLEEQQCAGFRIELGKDGNVVLSKFHLETPDGDEEIEKEVKAKIGAG